MVNVAQLVRALDCGSKGRGFEPHLSPTQKHVGFQRAFLLYASCDVDFILHGRKEMEKIKKEENRYVFFLLIVAEA